MERMTSAMCRATWKQGMTTAIEPRASTEGRSFSVHICGSATELKLMFPSRRGRVLLRMNARLVGRAVLRRLCRPAELPEAARQVEVGCRVDGLQPERPLEFGDGLGTAPLRHE